MTPRGFFDCLDVASADPRQAQAVEVEPVGDQSTDLDAAAEVAAFVDRPAPSAIEATRPAARSSSNSYSGSNRNTPLAEAAGIYSSGQR
ncbi:TPA: hypothetical protein MH415_30665 [Klebsiella pneumoniae]|uniref:hypothetical protein n=2 Tax=Pseudomonadota TaxID=1224 RepID=UPI001D84CD80|nr:hypothetical protein [Pseudomonas aeruginosa]MCE1050305.1 hypothetical protein [Pseudomonas alloputida]HBX5338420.1 hypothetical protein [Klebsiella pneumoniae]HBX5339132.1 hypothetical protein [Klebsiella pneumoniae]HCL3954749.1 hypothetical protein [Pseudomonas aeruginosa]